MRLPVKTGLRAATLGRNFFMKIVLMINISRSLNQTK
jgi:hypothetical protein